MGAKEDWVEIYDGYTDAELAAEVATLKEQVENPYVTQTEGQSGYTRSTNDTRDRLSAASQIKRERSAPKTPRHGFADFSSFQ